MQDPSFVDRLTHLTNADTLILAAGLGGFLLWGYWYRKGADTEHYFKIDQTNKKIRLGLFVSIAAGLFAGSAFGLYATEKGWNPDTTAVGAFFAGILGTWFLKALLNRSYATVCQIAQHPFFANNIGQHLPHGEQKALPAPSQVRPGLVTTTGLPMIPSVEDYNAQRAALTEQFLILHTRGSITKDEMIGLHRLLPTLPDLDEFQRDTTQLLQTRQTLTIGEKTDLLSLILTQQNQINRQSNLIDVQQDKLERAGLTMQPQNRIPRELVFAAAGALARHLIGMIL